MADNGKRKGITLLKVIIGLNYLFTALIILSCIVRFNIVAVVFGIFTAAIGYYLSIGSTKALKASIFLNGLGFTIYVIGAVAFFNSHPAGVAIFFLMALITGYMTYQQIQSTTLREELAERALQHQQKAAEEQGTFEALEKDELDRKAAEEAAALERQNEGHIKK